MTIFADASALIAIIAGEPDAAGLANAIEAHGERLYSAMSAWETIAGLSRSYATAPEVARFQLGLYLTTGSFKIVNIGPAEFEAAADAYARYGKGRHRASLNMGDCFAYACARTNGAKLLYKGSDFAHTDLA